jgi:hypothetical protein
LTVKLVGRGTVTGGGLDCTEQGAGPCRKKVVAGSTVLLTAAPAAGLVVIDWKGTSCGSGNNTCSVSVNGGTTVTVVFGPPPPTSVTLTVVVQGGGTVTGGGIDCTTQCTKKVVAGSTVLLTAAPAAGLVVTDWKGTSCGSGNNTCSVSVNGGTTVTVVFGPPPPTSVTLTVVVQGSGKVTDGRVIDCTTRCTQQFPVGEQVNLTAIPGTDWKIESWSDPACPGPTTNCALILNGDTTLTVTFAFVLG